MSKTSITTFRAFRNRNYSLFFCGQTVSQIGTWMQRTAVSWVVYSITHSALMLGFTVFAQQFPSFVLSLYGGIISDRYSRYKILLVTQTASMIQAILLAILTLTNHYAVWQILSLSVVLGIINAFDVPARQPLVSEMIDDKSDLPNALALNSSMVNLARLLGPALSGLVLLKFGAGICFLFNAVSFVAVLTSLLLMKLPVRQPSPPAKKAQAAFMDGFRYLKNTPDIGGVMLLLALMALLVLPFNTLLPVFAKVIFKGNAATFGYINSFIGLGALAGTFFLASLKPGTDLKKVLLGATIVFGAGLLFFARISYFPVAMVFATVCGFGMMSQTTICLTLIQVYSDEKMRGRVMSFGAMAYFGTLPLGSLLIGAVSQQAGSPVTIFCEGIIALIVAGIFSGFLRKGESKSTAIEPGEVEVSVAEKI
jgi:MFS family permease